MLLSIMTLSIMALRHVFIDMLSDVVLRVIVLSVIVLSVVVLNVVSSPNVTYPLLFITLTSVRNKLECLSLAGPSKAGAYPGEAPFRCSTLRRLHKY